MTFGEALEALKAGARVARSGWNGKGMWLALTAGTTISNTPPIQGRGWNGAARVLVEVEDPADVTINAHIDMRTADGSLTIGWAPSQVDMLASDWAVL